MRPNYFVFLIVFVCCFVSLAKSQAERSGMERNMQDFRDLFDEAISRNLEDTTPSGRFFYPNPERLPSWLFSEPRDSGNYLYVVAASDPGMGKEAATELALLRATIMFGLSSEINLAHLREYYTSERGDEITHVFTEYTRINVPLFILSEQVEVVEKHITQYDEAIILARVPKEMMSRSRRELSFGYVEAGLYTRLRGIDNRMQIEERLSIDLSPEDGSHGRRYRHQYALINRIVNSSTTLDDMLLSDLPALNLRYAIREAGLPETEVSEQRQQDGVSLRNGFWHALVAGMLSSMVDAAHQGSIHFSQLGDVYDAMLLSMSRELTGKTLVSSMPGLYIENNTLYLSPFVREVRDQP